jgi:hypothetical protein
MQDSQSDQTADQTNKQTNKQTNNLLKNISIFRKSHDANTENDNKTSSGNPELPSHPAPPPGFADDNNQFYLTEEMDTLNINSAQPVTGKNISELFRRNSRFVLSTKISLI